jgi:hypothetical protein
VVEHPVIPALGRLWQEDGELKSNLGYIVRPYLKTKTKQTKRMPRQLSFKNILALGLAEWLKW